jgi:hypothetical protein
MHTFTRNVVRVGLAAGLAFAGLFAAATPAAAADETVPGVKAALTARIDLRLAALDRDLAAITAAQHLTEAHRDQLSTVVNDASAGLTDLKAQVAQETTLPGVRAAAESMVHDYRVFLLVGPQVRLTIAGDTEQFAIDKAQQAHDTLADQVAGKKAAGTDTTAAETDLAEMQAAIDAARTRLDGQVATLLAIEPGPDAVAIRSAVAAVRQALGHTRADLQTARSEGLAVRAFLRGE